jgi:hypothetical protein
VVQFFRKVTLVKGKKPPTQRKNIEMPVRDISNAITTHTIDKTWMIVGIPLQLSSSESALFNSKTPELPDGSKQENLQKLFYPININKMNEWNGEFVGSTLYRDDMNPTE